jgi:hypothetical protein
VLLTEFLARYQTKVVVINHKPAEHAVLNRQTGKAEHAVLNRKIGDVENADYWTAIELAQIPQKIKAAKEVLENRNRVIEDTQLDETAEGQQQQQSGPAQTRQRQQESDCFNPFLPSFRKPIELDETAGGQQQQQSGPQSAPANAQKSPRGTAPQRRPQQNQQLQPMMGPPSGSFGGFGNSGNGAQGGGLSVMGTAQNGGLQNSGLGGGLSIMGTAQNGGLQSSGQGSGMRIRGAAGGLQPQAGATLQQQIKQAHRSGRSQRDQPRNQDGSRNNGAVRNGAQNGRNVGGAQAEEAHIDRDGDLDMERDDGAPGRGRSGRSGRGRRRGLRND